MKIVGVAIEYKGIYYSLSAPYRHHDVIQSIIRGNKNIKQVRSNNQGFITADGEFINRIDAAKMALESGQVEKLIAPPRLYSEDLW